MLKAGDKIPTRIKVLNEKGKKVTLKDYLKHSLVIYFYPKDLTPGCTTEARNFRALQREFNKLGFKILGVSQDSVESHLKFKKKYELNFELLSDPEHKLLEAFGVWQEKRMFDRSYMSTVRSSFLVDKSGEIIKVWPRVRPKDHPRQALSFVSKLVAKNKTKSIVASKI